MPNKETVEIKEIDVNQIDLFGSSIPEPQINRSNYRPEQLRHQKQILQWQESPYAIQQMHPVNLSR